MKDKLAIIRDDLAAVNARLTAVAVMRKDIDDANTLVRRLSDALRIAQSFIGTSHEGHRLWEDARDGTCRACDYFRNNKTRP